MDTDICRFLFYSCFASSLIFSFQFSVLMNSLTLVGVFVPQFSVAPISCLGSPLSSNSLFGLSCLNWLLSNQQNSCLLTDVTFLFF